MGKTDVQPAAPPKTNGDYRARNEARRRREAAEIVERRRYDRTVILECQTAKEVLARYTDRQQADALDAILAETMPDAYRRYVTNAKPPVLIAKRLDPDGFAETYARLAGDDGKPAADSLEAKPTAEPETWRLTGTHDG